MLKPKNEKSHAFVFIWLENIRKEKVSFRFGCLNTHSLDNDTNS